MEITEKQSLINQLEDLEAQLKPLYIQLEGLGEDVYEDPVNRIVAKSINNEIYPLQRRATYIKIQLKEIEQNEKDKELWRIRVEKVKSWPVYSRCNGYDILKFEGGVYILRDENGEEAYCGKLSRCRQVARGET